MTVNIRRWGGSVGFAATLILAVATPAAAAGPVQEPSGPPIGPNQAFVGVVNGAIGPSRIAVVCDGPIGPGGATGHPLPGQTVEARSVPEASTPEPGFTGASGTKVGVSLGTRAGAPIVLGYWQTRVEIPADVLVPCGGSAVVSFVPDPLSPTARRSAVHVRFFRVFT